MHDPTSEMESAGGYLVLASGMARTSSPASRSRMRSASRSKSSAVIVTTRSPIPSHRPTATWMDSTLPSGPLVTSTTWPTFLSSAL